MWLVNRLTSNLVIFNQGSMVNQARKNSKMGRRTTNKSNRHYHVSKTPKTNKVLNSFYLVQNYQLS